MRTYPHTWVDSFQTTEVAHFESDWAELADKLTTFTTCTADERDSQPLFTGWEMLPHDKAVFVKNHYSRRRENCAALQFLTLDVDNDPKHTDRPYWSFDEAIASLDGLTCLLYSSFNHLNKDKHNGVDKFRVVIPLLEPVPLPSYLVRAKDAQSVFPSAARESWTPSQPYWPPLQDPNRQHLSRTAVLEGELFDFGSLNIETEPEVRPRIIAQQIVDDTSIHDTYITDTIKHTNTIAGWYDLLQDGYDHRRACFSLERPEKNATAFIWRQHDFLYHRDMGLANTLKFRVRKDYRSESRLQLFRKNK